MSKATKFKLTAQELDNAEAPTEGQYIAVVVEAAVGSALHRLRLPDQTEVFSTLNNKFKNKFWIKAGNYVVFQRFPDATDTDKVQGDIVSILYKQQIKYFKSLNGVWPSCFLNEGETPTAEKNKAGTLMVQSYGIELGSDEDNDGSGSDESQDNGMRLGANPNQRRRDLLAQGDDDSDEDDEDDDEDRQ